MADPLDRLKTALADRYAVQRELGSGGMATVYLAEDTKLERKVAIKVLKPELAAVLGGERFLREVKITARLEHPHILGLYDSGEADGFLYYVMPYVEGESLRDRLVREKQLPIEDAVQIAREVADALSYAHSHDVIHRDIKPENILLSGGHARVADFGISRAVSAAGGDRLTATGVSLGTPMYMSPEQASGEHTLDGRSDLYSLGCVLYEMLAGDPPFTGPSVESVIHQHLAVPARAVTDVRPTTPPLIADALVQVLAKAPADRLPTAAAFAEILESDDTPWLGTRRVSTVGEWAPQHTLSERTFSLTEDVCRRLNRDTLDPHVIGDELHYLDNGADSNTLVCYLHGFGLDHVSFTEILEHIPHRAVAPSLYGFEPVARRRISLPLHDHAVVIREFLNALLSELAPKRVVLVGFSSGADLGFLVLNDPPSGRSPRLDAFLSLGCNLNLETCFASATMARLSAAQPEGVLAELKEFGAGATSLDEWLVLHEYLVRVLRKFGHDLDVLHALAAEVIAPFSGGGPSPFIGWYRMASERVSELRCIFTESEPELNELAAIRLANLDDGVLGDHYGADSLMTEPDVTHFDLLDLEVHRRHLEQLLKALDA